jgi:hypothetical protein
MSLLLQEPQSAEHTVKALRYKSRQAEKRWSLGGTGKIALRRPAVAASGEVLDPEQRRIKNGSEYASPQHWGRKRKERIWRPAARNTSKRCGT